MNVTNPAHAASLNRAIDNINRLFLWLVIYARRVLVSPGGMLRAENRFRTACSIVVLLLISVAGCGGGSGGSSTVNISGSATCGDGICSAGEDLTTCAADCTVCGDGMCSAGEDLGTCATDCAVCGDAMCTASAEDMVSCADDCCPGIADGACQAYAACGGFSDPADVRVSDEVTYDFNYEGGTYTRTARLYAPAQGTQTAPCPMIVVLPGGCQDKESAEWAGPLLASRGYVVFVAEVMAADVSGTVGPENAQVCSAAAQGAMDFIQSAANPFLSDSDTTKIAGAGYSLGARTWVETQEVDNRVDAIVAWDNLSISEDGDTGSPACANVPGVVRTPRVPAMGQASDQSCLVEPDRAGRDIDAKKYGFLHWRQAQIPSMELVFRDTGHGAWSGQESDLRPYFAYYTTNWFDRFVKGDTSATRRLLTRVLPVVLSNPTVPQLLSDEWRSAAFLDGYDCPDFMAGCPSGETVQWKWAVSGGGPGIDYSRGAACDATGRCVASGDLHNNNGTFGSFPVQFDQQSIAVENTVAAPIASYVWGISSTGQTETPAIVPGFASVDVDIQSDGTAIIAGRLFDDLSTQAGPLHSPTNTEDAAWVAMNRNGQRLFGAVFGGGAVDTINEVAIADDDDIVVTGPFGQGIAASRDMSFPDGSKAPFVGGDQDVFLARFSPMGAFEWGMGLQGDGHEEGRGVSVLPGGQVILCGEFDGELVIGSSTHQAVAASPDIFVMLLDKTGNVVWSRHFGGASRDVCRGIDPGMDGELIISGEYTGMLTLDNVTLTAHSADDRDIFIARLRASDGQVVAAKSIGSVGDDVGCEVETGEDDAVWCAGSASSALDYPGGRLPTTGNQFLIRFTKDLEQVDQAVALTGTGSTLNFAIGLAPGNRGIVVGSMAGSVSAFPYDISSPNGTNGFFVAGFGP